MSQKRNFLVLLCSYHFVVFSPALIQAHRREQKEIAAEESDRISDKILKNLLKQQLLKEAVQKKEKSKKEEKTPSVSVRVPGQSKHRDMFELEPLPEAKQR